jgi:hypothetical protein
MTPPHSTQRTLPALCSSSETQLEIKRLCVQAQGGLIGSGWIARFDSSRFIVHLSNCQEVLLADFCYRKPPIFATQDTKLWEQGRGATLLVLSGGEWTYLRDAMTSETMAGSLVKGDYGARVQSTGA